RREAQVIADLATAGGMVVATGGGVVLKPENRANLKSSGFVAYLNVPPHLLHERIRHDKSRPLLQVEDPLARLKELHALRDPLYREVADLVIDSSRLNAQTVALLLIKEIDDRW